MGRRVPLPSVLDDAMGSTVKFSTADPDAQVVELARRHAQDRGHHQSIQRQDVRYAERAMDHTLKVRR